MDVVNYLLGYSNLKIVQNTQKFKFSLDSVLLANFVTINKKINKILDIGCGNAPIPLILTQKTKAEIIGVEIQKEVYELAKKTVLLNNLEKQINLYNDDIKTLYLKWESDYFDVIVCNPPFFKINEKSRLNKSNFKTIARHEIDLDLENLFKIARKILKNNGKIAIVHRPDRLIEILDIMIKNNIIPKRLQFIYPKLEKNSNMILIEGVKNGNFGLTILPPLYIHDKNGNYNEEIVEKFQ